MEYAKRKLVTIIAEAPIEASLVDDIKELGNHGYTIWEARGEGSRGVRDADWDQNRNIVIQIICDKSKADALTEHIHKKYYSNYAVVLYQSDVDVLRPEKF